MVEVRVVGGGGDWRLWLFGANGYRIRELLIGRVRSVISSLMVIESS